MAQETVTEYKTMEEQKTRTLCDNCGRTDEESQIITVAINPITETEEKIDYTLLSRHEDEIEAMKEMSNWKLQQIHDEAYYGVAESRSSEVKNTSVSANADVCASCVFDLFDIEIPEDEEVDEIEIEEGELNINTNRIVFVEDRYSLLFSMIAWPFIIGLDFFDVLDGSSENIGDYIGGSLSAGLWLTALFIILMFLF